MLNIGGGELERRNGKVLYWAFLTLLLLAAWALTSCSNLWLPGNVETGTAVNDPSAVSVPKPPTGVSASFDTYTDKVRVTWTLNGAPSYEVWRNTSNSTSSATRIASVNSSPCDDTAATPGTTYYYWVKAKNAAGTSGFSASATGRYTSYTLAWPQSWRNPLGANSVLTTNTAYDFNSSTYLSNWGKRHTGIDIKAGPDTPVFAIAAGTIIKVTRTVSANPTPDEAMTLVVIVQHTGSQGPFFCVYGHIYAAAGIKAGDQIKAGTQLGVVKQAGSPSHLHFGINTTPSKDYFMSSILPLGWGTVPQSIDPTSKGWVNPIVYLLFHPWFT